MLLHKGDIINLQLSSFLVLLFVMVGCASADTDITTSGYNIVSSGTYQLKGNITAVGSGILNNADDVIVFGHGYTIFYENSAWGYGFRGSTAHSNVTLKDINFVCINGSYTDGSAIYSTAINGLHLINCTANTSAGDGISIQNSEGSSIVNCTGITSANACHGIYLSSNDNLTIQNVTAICTHPTTTSGNGFYSNDTNYLTIDGLIATSIKSAGATIQYNTYGNISNVLGTTQNNTGTYLLNFNFIGCSNVSGTSYSSKGIRLTNARNNTLVGGTASSISDQALFLAAAENNSISDYNCTSVDVEAVHFETTALNNTFSGMTVSSPYGSTPHAEKHVMGIGDSVTYLGYGTHLNNTLNSINPTWYYSNRGRNGETGVNATLRFEQELEVYAPQYVCIMYGTNDLYHELPQEDIVDAVMEMARITREHNAIPYILLVTPSLGENTSKLALNAALKSAANDEEYQVIDSWDSVDTFPENGIDETYNAIYFQDSDHPNNAGAQALGSYIANKMLRSAEFNSTGNSGTASYIVQFLDRSPYATAWYWDFENDGIVDSNKKNPTHTYEKAGNYSVNLTVHNEYGSFSTMKTNYITIFAHTKPSMLEQFLKTLKYYFRAVY